MESTVGLQSFFDQEGSYDFSFDEFDDTRIQNQLGLKSAESMVITDSPLHGSSDLNTPTTPTLASINGYEYDEESENFFNLDFEGSALNSTVNLTVDTDHTYSHSTKPLSKEKLEPFRSPSPMSMTASLSGSEPSSSPRRSDFDTMDETEDLLDYLLEDAGIKADTKADEDEYYGEQNLSTSTRHARPRRQSVTCKRSISSTDRGVIKGVSHQSGPWCKTKTRNNSKNAVAARENRQKKKQYLQALEDMNLQLTEENSRLKKESSQAETRISNLEEEVGYLRRVLFNQSALAGILKKMDQNDVVLSTNFKSDGDKRQQDEASSSSSSGGVCVHVNDTDCIWTA